MSSGLKILLVDDEPTIRLVVGDVIRAAGHDVVIAQDGAEGFAHITSDAFDVVISDIRMPKMNGLELFRKIKTHSPTTDVILITAFGEVDDAVAAMKEGLTDYLTKPFDHDEIILRLARIAQYRNIENELREIRANLQSDRPKVIMVGQSPSMVRLKARTETIAQSDASVIIAGESGTGKELVARTLHARSSRADHPMVVVNCAAFPETLLEAELFGHEKGAFTGATKSRDGRFKTANGGTLFLDEIGEIPLLAQVKLLRVLQDGVIEPLGSDTPINVDVRVISATHRDLKQMIAEGTFREDLYYRLNVLDIRVPPLRERRADLPLLVEHFLDRHTAKDHPRPRISPRAWAALSQYAFPGNVRELEHAIHHAVVLSAGHEIDLPHLPEDIAGTSEDEEAIEVTHFRPLADATREFEREYLLRALNRTDGKKTRAAEILGISRKNLWEKLRAHRLGDSDLQD